MSEPAARSSASAHRSLDRYKLLAVRRGLCVRYVRRSACHVSVVRGLVRPSAVSAASCVQPSFAVLRSSTAHLARFRGSQSAASMVAFIKIHQEIPSNTHRNHRLCNKKRVRPAARHGASGASRLLQCAARAAIVSRPCGRHHRSMRAHARAARSQLCHNIFGATARQQ